VSDLGRLSTEIDPQIPNIARIYDYYLGGTNNSPADRAAADKLSELGRQMGNDARETARANRAFLRRAVHRLAQGGVRQFVDIGAGLPTQDNVHQVAARHAPDSRVVYVDNDPAVVAHARALLADAPHAISVPGDLRDPDAILDDPQVGAIIDFTRPYAVLLVSVLHFVTDDEEATRIVTRIRDRLTPGSVFVLSHISAGNLADDVSRIGRQIYSNTASGGLATRGYEQIARYFDGLELLAPGVVPAAMWNPEAPPDSPIDYDRPGILAGVARVPG
jgi:O-methyltransferase involved in polyketide biosynthesis